MKLRGAVVGVGYLGRFHAQKIKAHADAELVGVCDYSYEQAQKVAEELSVKAFLQPQELIGKIDFVHIVASTQAHYDLTELFLKAKIPVLVEKPIAATVEQARKLCELAQQQQTLLTVGHIERFNPAFKFLKQYVQGASYFEMNRLAPFRIRGSDVSVLHDLTIHDIDLVNWLFQSEIVDVQVAGKKLIRPTYDDVSIRLKLANQTQVTINNSRITSQIVRNCRLVAKDQTILMNTATLEAEILKSTSEDPFYAVEKIQIEKQDALALEVDHFIQALKGRCPLAITANEATQALITIEKFVEQLDRQNQALVNMQSGRL